ncbi:MAG: OmpH family outer membrane protein [Sphingobacteriaceae bacterium]|nr:OmpH family outer membrane protein [Sphingobacteriaceae bacterium]
MNKAIIGLNAVLLIAVAFLFYKVSNIGKADESNSETPIEAKASETEKAPVKNNLSEATTPTGKIAFVNIDVINEQSEEIKDLVAEAKRSKGNMEASIERLSMEYQRKMEAYQASAKAGIAPESEMLAKQKEIMAIEKEAQNKQIQIDNFTMSINEKNMAFQQSLKDFLVKWNNGRYDYILSYSDAVPTMLLGNANLDVTQEIMAKVNEEYLAKKEAAKKKK